MQWAPVVFVRWAKFNDGPFLRQKDFAIGSVWLHQRTHKDSAEDLKSLKPGGNYKCRLTITNCAILYLLVFYSSQCEQILIMII